MDLKLEVVSAPPALIAACRSMMRDLNIVFGYIDFIVTTEGDHFYLEVNEMGQFLWIEELLPEIGLLNKFCAFLTGRDAPGQAEQASFRQLRREPEFQNYYLKLSEGYEMLPLHD